MKEKQMKTKDKRINLRIWMGAKIFPALFLFGYYWMCIRRDFKPVYIIIQYALIGGMLVSLLIIRSKLDIFDEFAKETLYKTDSICLKVAYIIMGFMLIPSAIINPDAVMIGYLIAGGIVVLTIVRAIIFCVIDGRGM